MKLDTEAHKAFRELAEKLEWQDAPEKCAEHICRKCSRMLLTLIERCEIEGTAICTWRYEERNDYWQTDCGNEFVLMNGTPKDNGMKCCPHCGKVIAEATDEKD